MKLLEAEYHDKEQGTIPYLKYKWQIIHALTTYLKPSRKHEYLNCCVRPVMARNIVWSYGGQKVYKIPEPLLNEIVEECGCTIDRPMDWCFYWSIMAPHDIEQQLVDGLARCEQDLEDAGYVADLDEVQRMQRTVARRHFPRGSGLD